MYVVGAADGGDAAGAAAAAAAGDGNDTDGADPNSSHTGTLTATLRTCTFTVDTTAWK